MEDVNKLKPSFLSSDESLAVHAGERLGREIVTNSIRTPAVSTTTYFYKNSSELIDSKPTLIDATDIAGLQAIVNNHGVSMFFTESPTNPFLRCVDIKLVSEICHKRGTLVCIDGTIATPLNQKALALGADLVIQSATKYIGGHNDVLAGCISGSMKLVSEIRIMHNLLGGTLSPTMHLRVKQQNSTALRMAHVLEAHPKNPRHPEHHIAKRKMTDFGGLVTFETTIKFIDSLKIPYIATSFGGCESFVDQPAARNWDVPRDERLKYGLKDNLVRFSFGVEDFDDLKADILQALDTIPTKTSLYSHQNGVVSDKN
ncbi:hypothetical protein HID58_089054 [Brassica napus]|uniref:Cystathionine gamma-synthase n=1 Tax=Brassica napus TaxID=3708 RepID=A0ABQ7XXY0_BRANA|nr:hypothetical protein HID58_089054 [Brassica napus]